MYSPRSNSTPDGGSNKPMRKGTHSCLECRQRKIRCVNLPNTRKCNGCVARDLKCTDQQFRRSRSPDSSGRNTIEDRVRRLESMLKQVRNEKPGTRGGYRQPLGSNEKGTESDLSASPVSKPQSIRASQSQPGPSRLQGRCFLASFCLFLCLFIYR